MEAILGMPSEGSFMPRVAVPKELEWGERYWSDYDVALVAEFGFFNYEITAVRSNGPATLCKPPRVRSDDDFVYEDYPSVEDAKKAAQEDFNTFVMGLIEWNELVID